MAVLRTPYADLLATRLDDIVAARLGHGPRSQGHEIVLEDEDHEDGTEDQQPGEYYPGRTAERQPLRQESAADQQKAADKINETKRLVAVIHNSISSPS